MTPRPPAFVFAFAFGLAVVFPLLTLRADEPDNDSIARSFVAKHETRIRPLEIAASLAWWNANITGKDEDFKAKEEAQNKLDAALADRERFAELKAIKEAARSTTRSLARADRRALPAVPGKAGRPRPAQAR